MNVDTLETFRTTSGRVDLVHTRDARTGERINVIRYPWPNRLGLTREG